VQALGGLHGPAGVAGWSGDLVAASTAQGRFEVVDVLFVLDMVL
jgi:hypothetical protein